MEILIIGVGKVGYSVAASLRQEGCNVTVLDSNQDVVTNAAEELDVMGICGSGSIISSLEEAGVKTADLVVATTATDEVNVFACVLARKLGAKSCVARVREPKFYEQSSFLSDELGIDSMINPESAAADEISRMLRFPSAVKVDIFSRGRVEMAELKIEAGSPLIGQALYEFPVKYKQRVLVCVVTRGDEVYIPRADFRLEEGDTIHITSSHDGLQSFLKTAGFITKRVRSVMIIGGGRIAFYLAARLIESGFSVKIFESDPKRAELLSQVLPKALIICADGTDQDILLTEGLEDSDACVALTGIDEENIIISMFARRRGVGKVITKINKSTLRNMAETVGLESTIAPRTLTSTMIIGHVRAMQNAQGSNVTKLYKLIGDRVEALEFIAKKGSKVIGTPLRLMKMRKNILLAGIIRGQTTIFPNGDTVIAPDDNVIVVTTLEKLADLDEILI